MNNDTSDIWNAQSNKMLDDAVRKTDNQPCREALLPCPFCGGKSKVYRKKDGIDKDWFYVQCDGEINKLSCCNTFAGKETHQEAHKAWNTRTPPISYEAAVEKVADAINEKMHSLGYESDEKPEKVAFLERELAKAALAAMGISEGKDA